MTKNDNTVAIGHNRKPAALETTKASQVAINCDLLLIDIRNAAQNRCLHSYFSTNLRTRPWLARFMERRSASGTTGWMSAFDPTRTFLTKGEPVCRGSASLDEAGQTVGAELVLSAQLWLMSFCLNAENSQTEIWLTEMVDGYGLRY